LATAKMGDEMYKDLDGDNQITVKDQVNIGTTDPKLIYGVALNIQYKKWGISILGNGADDFVGGSSYLQISENQRCIPIFWIISSLTRKSYKILEI